MEQIKEFADRYLTQIQFIGPMDIVEIILISLMVYYLLIFIRNTRAWQLLKGVFVILVFLVIAEILQMDTILWIARTAFQFATIALIVVLQPELRKALEQLGQKNLIRSVIPFESSKPEEGLFSDRTIREIVKGCVEMSRAKTGALIVVRQLDSLAEYERTGIAVDGIVTSQLLINIFEKNTPLHDGAVIVQGNRVTYATCYLPLSDNMRLSKDLGTRHRAGVGISEVTDSMTVIVSEENGKISVAYEGTLSRGLTAEELEEILKDKAEFIGERSGTDVLLGMFPEKLSDVILKRAGISMKKKSREWKEADWNHLIGQIKKFTFHITRCRGYEQAQVCTGGVPLAELKNCSMESAKVPGLYLCGELLDVDGACGGYNLQWAWTSGYLAGNAAGSEE